MIRSTLASIFLVGMAAATTPQVYAGSLDGLDTLTGLVSGDSTSALMGAGLSGLGLTAEQIEQATPILEQSIAKGKEIMQSYNFSPEAENNLSATDLSKLKGELNKVISSSTSLLSGFLSPDMLDPVMSLVKSQLPGNLL